MPIDQRLARKALADVQATLDRAAVNYVDENGDTGYLAIADKLSARPKTLRRKLNQHDDEAYPNLSELIQICVETDCPGPLLVLGRLGQSFKANDSKQSIYDLMRLAQQVAHEALDCILEVGDDSKVTESERKRVLDVKQRLRDLGDIMDASLQVGAVDKA